MADDQATTLEASQETGQTPSSGNGKPTAKTKTEKPETGNGTKSMTISEMTGYEPDLIRVIQETVAKKTAPMELVYFLKIAKGLDLNPLTKEIWCYKDNKGNLLIFAGRDGFLTVAQRDPQFQGLRSSEVCKSDIFELDIPNAIIIHKISVKEPRGPIVGAYAIAYRKNGEKTIEWAETATYDKGSNAWASHKAEMIKKVAEVHALRKAFGIHGLYVEEEFVIKNEVVVSDTPTKELPSASKPDFVAQIKGILAEKMGGKGKGWTPVAAYLKEKTGKDLTAKQVDDLSEKEAQDILAKLLM